MARIKKGDTVTVLAGKSKGKTGKVLKVFPEPGNAVVEGVNLVKKAVRQRRQEQQGGIIQMEAPVRLSNLALFCKGCNKSVRVGFTELADGTKTRICRKCQEMI